MIVALDAHYPAKGPARTAGVLFADWRDREPLREIVRETTAPRPYQPGAFYRRELPGLLAVIKAAGAGPAAGASSAAAAGRLEAAVVDGYVWLGPSESRPGLGFFLWEALEGTVPVVGVAKSSFAGAPAIPVFRRSSQRPLYVTGVGMPAPLAARCLIFMHGAHRIPTLLKWADRLARGDGGRI